MKKVKYIIASLAFVLALQSCDSLLDSDDPNKVTENTVVKDLAGLESINKGFYRALPLELNYFNQSLVTDEFVFPFSGNLGGGVGQYTWSYGPGTVTERDDITDLYIGFYSAIRRANISIANIDNIIPKTESETHLKRMLKGEAYAMRALSHFYILRNFSPKYGPTELGCAYVTGVDDYATPARLTMEESYNRILQDLAISLESFPDNAPAGYGGTSGNNRLTKKAAYALLAKINLEIGKYDEVITASTTIINTNVLTPANQYVNVWNDSNDGQEVIFKQANIQNAGANPGQRFFNISSAVQWNASATLLSKYESNDVRRKELFIDLKTKGIIPGKYILPSQPGGIKPIRGLADIKLLRLADILLVRSEAYARKGDLNKAFEDYKALRDIRNAGPSTAFTSVDDALNNILDERARELAYEGERLSDIKRYGKTIIRVKEDTRPNYTTLTFTDIPKYTYPIPFHEMNANSKMVQNTGWK